MYVIGGLDGAYRYNTPYYHGAGKLDKLAQAQSMSAKDMSEYTAYLDCLAAIAKVAPQAISHVRLSAVLDNIVYCVRSSYPEKHTDDAIHLTQVQKKALSLLRDLTMNAPASLSPERRA